MNDARFDDLANLLVGYSIRLKRNETVLIEVFDVPDEMTIALIRAARNVGGIPFLHKRNAADVSSRSDQRDCHFVRNVEYLNQNRFIALESNRISHKKVGEIVESGVVHKGL